MTTLMIVLQQRTKIEMLIKRVEQRLVASSSSRPAPHRSTSSPTTATHSHRARRPLLMMTVLMVLIRKDVVGPEDVFEGTLASEVRRVRSRDGEGGEREGWGCLLGMRRETKGGRGGRREGNEAVVGGGGGGERVGCRGRVGWVLLS